jgi:hypothetical protein
MRSIVLICALIAPGAFAAGVPVPPRAITTGVAVAPQYDSTHVYLAPADRMANCPTRMDTRLRAMKLPI